MILQELKKTFLTIILCTRIPVSVNIFPERNFTLSRSRGGLMSQDDVSDASIREDEREAEMYTLRYVNRWPLSKIGEKFDVSPQRVHQILQRRKKNLPPLDFEAMRRESLELHQRSQQMLADLAGREGAPTFTKDGIALYGPDGKQVLDYSLRVQALAEMRKSDLEIRKLHGLDAATKIEQSGTVRYEIAGIEPDALS